MSIESLLGMTADELEKMSDVELKAYTEQYYKVTRPELAPRPIQSTRTNSIVTTKKFAASAALLKAQGIDVDYLLRKKK